MLHSNSRARALNDLLNLCRRFLQLFDYKKLREKDLQNKYTTKVIRLRSALKYKGRLTLPLQFNPLQLRCCPPKTGGQ